MPLPTVKSCLCLSLRVAGLSIGLIAILIDLLSVYIFVYINKDDHSTEDGWDGVWELPLTSICLLFAVGWIVGILKESTKLMLPFLILSFIGVVIFVFLPFFLLFVFSAKNTDPILGSLLFGIFCYIGGLAVYTWVIEFSLYKQIKEITFEKYERRNGV